MLKILKKKKLLTGEMYENHYAKRVANKQTKCLENFPPKENFYEKLLGALSKNLHVSSLVEDVASNRKDS